MTLSLPDQKNPTNLFLEAVFPLLTNNSNADIVCVCATILAPHFAAKAKEKTPAAAAARQRQRPGRAWAVQLFIFSAWEGGVVLFSLSLLYSRQSFAERERERN
jgi:hypothetical protein